MSSERIPSFPSDFTNDLDAAIDRVAETVFYHFTETSDKERLKKALTELLRTFATHLPR